MATQVRTLDQVEPCERCRVRCVTGSGRIRRRLMDMGLCRGTEIEVIRTAPMGDPIEYKVRGYHLSLRKSEAQLIQVE